MTQPNGIEGYRKVGTGRVEAGDVFDAFDEILHPDVIREMKRGKRPDRIVEYIRNYLSRLSREDDWNGDVEVGVSPNHYNVRQNPLGMQSANIHNLRLDVPDGQAPREVLLTSPDGKESEWKPRTIGANPQGLITSTRGEVGYALVEVPLDATTSEEIVSFGADLHTGSAVKGTEAYIPKRLKPGQKLIVTGPDQRVVLLAEKIIAPGERRFRLPGIHPPYPAGVWGCAYRMREAQKPT